ncbi:MAG: hypothetical protein ACE5EE_01910 [Fidelibacterota bacterium]
MNNLKRYTFLIIPIIVFIFLGEMIIDDLSPSRGDLVEGLPVRKWGFDYMAEHHEIPHWYPHLYSGMPSYSAYSFSPSDPVGETLRPLLFNLGFKFWFYFSIGGIGMFLFLRRKKLGHIPALFGALSFALTPYLFGLINAGHGTKIFTFCYLPFIMLAVDYILSSASWKGGLYLGLVTALQIWAKHPQIVYYTWMLVVFIWLWHQGCALFERRWSLKIQGKQNVILIVSLLMAGLLVIDPFASVMEFQSYSTRGAPSVLDNTNETQTGTTWEYATRWSLHPKETISYVYPYFYGLQNFPTRDAKQAAYWGYMSTTQSTYYLGLVVILLAVFSFVLKKPDRESWIWLIASFIILLIGFGKYFPLLYKPLFELAPMYSKFRVPSMIYILLSFTVGILGARGLHVILSILKSRNKEDLQRLKSRVLLIIGSIAILSMLLLLFNESILFIKSGQQPVPQQVIDTRKELFEKGALIALLISLSSLGILWGGVKKLITPFTLGVLIIGIGMLDLWIVNNEFLNLSKTSQVEGEFERARRGKVVKKLLQDKEHYRIIPIDDLTTNFFGYFGISSVIGYRPVKIRKYQDLLDAGGLEQLHIRDMLNVKYFVGKRGIQEIETALPKAWIVSNVVSVPDQKSSLEQTLASFNPAQTAIVVNYDGPEIISGSTGTVEVQSYEEHEIVLKASTEKGGLLVLSEIYYPPRWTASIDGKETTIFQTNHVLRAVYVPSGEHEVVFRFDVSLFKKTRMISRISLSLLLLSIMFIQRERLKESWRNLSSRKQGN